jgi:hypothetical protein
VKELFAFLFNILLADKPVLSYALAISSSAYFGICLLEATRYLDYSVIRIPKTAIFSVFLSAAVAIVVVTLVNVVVS